ncbi:MAG: hypothetical protein D8H95_36545 [Lachnospiraceae bacterium]|nr:MAG: hypothetical protein D8H95_36545 [Lachnospiraceae bacterium]
MLKRMIVLLLLILEFILVAAANIINYFTHKRIGMARHMVYMNQKWLAISNFEVYKMLSFILVFVFTAILIYSFVRIRKNTKFITKINLGVLVVFFVYFIYFSTVNSIKGMRAFYLMYYIYLAALLLMLINAFINIASDRTKPKSSK